MNLNLRDVKFHGNLRKLFSFSENKPKKMFLDLNIFERNQNIRSYFSFTKKVLNVPNIRFKLLRKLSYILIYDLFL